MKAALYYFGTGLVILAASILFDCNRHNVPDKADVYIRVKEAKAKLVFQDSCIAAHLDSIRSRVKASSDTALYDLVIDDLDDALYHVQEGDEVFTDLDALQYDLL